MYVIFIRNLLDCLIGEKRRVIGTKGRVCCEYYPVFGAIVNYILLRARRVQLNLVHSWDNLDFFEKTFEILDRKVGYTY